MQEVSVPKAPLAWSLLGLRLGVALVMIMWTLVKFIHPENTAAVFKVFYGVSDLSTFGAYIIGALQAAVVLAFLVGFQKRWATAAVFVIHLVSTLASYPRYLDPWTSPNLLFYAAWPMLAAIAALYLLRNFDTLWSLETPLASKRSAAQESTS